MIPRASERSWSVPIVGSRPLLLPPQALSRSAAQRSRWPALREISTWGIPESLTILASLSPSSIQPLWRLRQKSASWVLTSCGACATMVSVRGEEDIVKNTTRTEAMKATSAKIEAMRTAGIVVPRLRRVHLESAPIVVLEAMAAEARALVAYWREVEADAVSGSVEFRDGSIHDAASARSSARHYEAELERVNVAIQRRTP